MDALPLEMPAGKVSYPCGSVRVVGDRLAALGRARPWAMPAPELIDAVDLAQALVVEANAVLLGLVREVDARGIAKEQGASSTAVWLRDRHRVSVRSAHRMVKTAAELDTAPAVLGEAVAAGVVNRDQAETILRSLARLPRDVGVDIRGRAAAALVEFCAGHDPESLTLLGDRILHLVAPEVADEADREAVEQAEETAQEKRFFTLSPDPDGIGVRLRGPAHRRRCRRGAGGDRAAVRADGRGWPVGGAAPRRRPGRRVPARLEDGGPAPSTAAAARSWWSASTSTW